MSDLHHNQYEAAEQIKLFRWVDLVSKNYYPELRLLYHVPNGGSRNELEAVNLKKQGVRSGVPDLCLPVARGGYHGLYIELKYGKNKPTEKQLEWIEALRDEGYAVSICWGFEAARAELEKYLKLDCLRLED